MEGNGCRAAYKYRRRHEWRQASSTTDSALVPSAGTPICFAGQLFATDTAACPPLNCLKCRRPMLFIAIGQCRDLLCWVCSAKLRLLQKVKGCPFCKIELPYVVLARAPPFREYLPPKLRKKLLSSRGKSSESGALNEQVFACLRTWLASKYSLEPNQYPAELVDESVGIIFANLQSKRAYEALSQYICWHPKCTSSSFPVNTTARVLPFPTQKAWMAHCASAHAAEICGICAGALNVFPFELLLYAPTDLTRHIKEGDKLSDGVIEPHHPCSVCHKFFFNVDAYTQHVKKDHLTCYMCNEAAGAENPPTAPPAFRTRDGLGQHYAEKHVVCPLCEFVGLRNEVDLALHNSQSHPPSNSKRPTGPRRDSRPDPNRRRPAPERRSNRELKVRRDVKENPQLSEKIQDREQHKHKQRKNPEEGPSQVNKVGNAKSNHARVSYRLVDGETNLSQAGQHQSAHTNEEKVAARKQVQKAPKRNSDKSGQRRTGRPQSFWQYEDPVGENWRLVAHLAARQAHTSTVATRERANSKLLKALHAFFGDHERGKRELDRLLALSRRWTNKELESVDFLREMLAIFWHYYPKDHFSRPRSEPQSWTSWREHRARLHPSFELINLLVSAQEPAQLTIALETVAMDPNLQGPIDKFCAPETHSATPNDQKNGVFNDNEEQVLLTESKQSSVDSTKNTPSVTMKEATHLNGSEGQTAIATAPTSAQVDLRNSSEPHQHRGPTFSKPIELDNNGARPELADRHTNDRQASSNVGPNDPSIVTLSQALFRGTKKSLPTVKSLAEHLKKIHLDQRPLRISTSPPDPSDDENEGEFPLEVIPGATFLDALITGVHLLHVMQRRQIEASFVLPDAIKNQLDETSRANLAVLGNFKAHSADFMSSKAVEKIQALRPLYFLMTKQAETDIQAEKSLKKNEWVRRVRATLTALNEKELDFLAAYLDYVRALLAEAAQPEDFPALDGKCAGGDALSCNAYGVGVKRVESRSTPTRSAELRAKAAWVHIDRKP